jgi:hypothetical protein
MGSEQDGGTSAVRASFRDPSGFVFVHDGQVLRQVNARYREDYDYLMASGLYEALTGPGQMVAHEELGAGLAQSPEAYQVIRPARIPFISYPYEWSFSQLRDAALLTLQVARTALAHGMLLKDATAYNIQFPGGKPCLIDTLSLERYTEGRPWAAYRQFCQHFVAPLAVMAHTDIRLGSLLRSHLDGLPLDLAARLLPGRTRLSPGLLTHVHLHARLQASRGGGSPQPATGARAFSRLAFEGLLDSLRGTITKLRWSAGGTEWADYYDEASHYSDSAMAFKQQWVREAVGTASPRTVWDLGANTGVFSRIAAESADLVVALDLDPACVERNYLSTRGGPATPVLPLLMDLSNPSPGLGWAHEERSSLLERGPADMAIALAVIHHLGLSNNTTFPMMARFLGQACRWLAIEFVPLHDPKAQVLIGTGRDASVFDWYTQAGFEEAFGAHFAVRRRDPVPGTERTLYLMERTA